MVQKLLILAVNKCQHDFGMQRPPFLQHSRCSFLMMFVYF